MKLETFMTIVLWVAGTIAVIGTIALINMGIRSQTLRELFNKEEK